MNPGKHAGQVSSLPVLAASLPPKCSAGRMPAEAAARMAALRPRAEALISRPLFRVGSRVCFRIDLAHRQPRAVSDFGLRIVTRLFQSDAGGLRVRGE